MENNDKGITWEEFKKLPFKQKFYYLVCLIIGVLILPFYLIKLGINKIKNKFKEKKNGRNNKTNN